MTIAHELEGPATNPPELSSVVAVGPAEKLRTLLSELPLLPKQIEELQEEVRNISNDQSNLNRGPQVQERLGQLKTLRDLYADMWEERTRLIAILGAQAYID